MKPDDPTDLVDFVPRSHCVVIESISGLIQPETLDYQWNTPKDKTGHLHFLFFDVSGFKINTNERMSMNQKQAPGLKFWLPTA